MKTPHSTPTPNDLLARLEEGNRRFLNGSAQEGRLGSRHTFAFEQKPTAAVLACSDSRVPVETVLDQGIGDVFVVRVAGNIAAPASLGSLEFAVDQLDVRLIVVLGHTHCGAVAAAMADLDAGEGASGYGGHVASIVDPISRALGARSDSDDRSGPLSMREAVALNVHHVCSELRSRSGVLSEYLDTSKLEVVGACYDMETGRVDFFT